MAIFSEETQTGFDHGLGLEELESAREAKYDLFMTSRGKDWSSLFLFAHFVIQGFRSPSRL